MFNSLPVSDIPQNSFPDRNKEVLQQTDWQYLVTEKLQYYPALLFSQKEYSSANDAFYKSSQVNTIFHPPCFHETV